MTTAEQMLTLFRGRPDYVAIPNGSGFKPHRLKEPLKACDFESEHLKGKRCLGFYLLDEHSKCRCTAVDFDNKPETPDPEWREKAIQVYFELTGYGLTPSVEVSQSGNAAHVWLFFNEPVDAWLIRQFWTAIGEKAGVSLREVYPRQDELTGKQLGNLLRYPLYGESRFVDAESDWKDVDPLVAMQGARTTDTATLRQLLYTMTGKVPRKLENGVSEAGIPARVDRMLDRDHTLLARRWNGDMAHLGDKSRSALVQSIACELVRMYVPTPEIELALKVWCDQNDYKKGDRDDWISTTVRKAYEFVADRHTEAAQTSWTMQDAIHEFISSIGTAEAHIGTGIFDVDHSIDGVGTGEMAVVAARPAHGKTAFGLSWVDHAAKNALPCLVVSEEMSRMELAKRALLSISKLNMQDWDGNQITLNEETLDHYRNRAPVYGVEACQSIDKVERVIDEHCELRGVKLVAVDYMQLLSGQNHSSRYESVSEISRRLKQMAVKYRIGMLVMCQLNREIEKREVKHPLLSDLRESGQIEQDADLVLFLQRSVLVDARKDPKEYVVWCSKRRNGPTRVPKVMTTFDPDRQKFGG